MNTIDGLIMNIMTELNCKASDMDEALFRIRYNLEDRFIVSKAVKELDELIPDAIDRINHALDIYNELKDRLEIEGIILDETSFNKEKEKEEAEENRKKELKRKIDEFEQQKQKLIGELASIEQTE